jgi:hypothetical protein
MKGFRHLAFQACSRLCAGFSLVLLAGCYTPTELTLKAVPKGEWIEVSGASSIPDGAQFLVGLYPKNAQEPIAQALPILKKGKYVGKLKTGKLAKGSYLMQVEFSPRAFTWSTQVLPAVGKNGEKLHGPLVARSSDGCRVLRRQQWLQIN